MERSKRKALSVLAALVTLLLGAYFIAANTGSFAQLLDIALHPENILPLAGIALLAVLFVFFNSRTLDHLMLPFNIRLTPHESFGLSIVTGFYNLVTPFRGGAALRALYLKKRHKFPYTQFLATLSASYVLIFLVNSAVGLLSMLLLYSQKGVVNWPIALLLAVFFAALALFIILSPALKETKYLHLNYLIRVINGWQTIKKNMHIVRTTVVISLLQIAVLSLSLLWAYQILGVRISALDAVFIASIGSLSLLIAVTPGNLGIGDAVNIYLATILGISVPQSLAVAIVQRMVSFIVLAILGPAYSHRLLNQHRRRHEH